MDKDTGRQAERRRVYGMVRPGPTVGRGIAPTPLETGLAVLGGGLTADWGSWWGILKGVLGGLAALLLWEFVLRPLRHYIWTVPADLHLKEAEKRDALAREHSKTQGELAKLHERMEPKLSFVFEPDRPPYLQELYIVPDGASKPIRDRRYRVSIIAGIYISALGNQWFDQRCLVVGRRIH